ncbi:MAG: NAD(P)H-hydrate dehydratase [Verrucomicrobia bacterium]|nr:NAD(P)H-hydrate dehydratase [Pseudomonadota bacterium]NBS06777.1 NAD(P)H-hydrate dehydratase [Verrucomicrobiota bacterium]NBS79048.1 NAD(P)H-hydrate dehydratase [bacterium]NBS49519.1 NAD(P)H-hydrate dehydratase [Verrucomicrobiota bacterium]NBV96623.1 NAD(P)H-hydrate dehydratase [Verrucomicrobiota bacterium]
MIVLSPPMARSWEKRSLEAGARMKDLMRQAVDGALLELLPFLPKPGTALVLLGSGHNGEDAALLGIELKRVGWKVEFLLSRSPGKRKHPDPRVKTKFWKKALVWPRKPTLFLQADGPRLVIDGILGLGATPPPRPAEAEMISWVAGQKRGSDLYVALDLPSGLDPADGSAPGPVFPADLTIALGSVKEGCLRDSALPFVGQLRAAPVDFGTPAPKSSLDFFRPQDAWQSLRSRPSNLHKHSAGVVHLWAGSTEYPGAASLTSSGALRSGAGYVRLFTDLAVAESLSPHIPELLLHRLPPRSAPPPEIFSQHASALVIGPGLPASEALEAFLVRLLPTTKIPIVLDAGALETLARRPEILATASGPVLLTPHAGELSRLLGHPLRDRSDAAREWLEKFPGTLLLAKGPHTLVAAGGHPLSFNSSGGPAQATAGMGDLLAGMLGGLLSVGYPPFDAARLAVSWHGLASDLVIQQGGPSTLATDLLPMLPASWRILAGRAG